MAIKVWTKGALMGGSKWVRLSNRRGVDFLHLTVCLAYVPQPG